jgi:transglutaminase-like putative cysteine protease
VRIAVSHTTRVEHDDPVVESVMDVRLGPLSDEHQRWRHFDLRIAPHASVRRYTDAFGNAAHLITVPRPHRTLEVVMHAEVETLLDDPFRAPDRPPEALDRLDRADHLVSTVLVPRHRELAALAGMVSADDVLARAQGLMRLVHEHLQYEPDSTNVYTTAPDVLAQRRGVCQDFAHVLLGLCRSAGLPSRYVSGYIVGEHDDRPRGSPEQRGAHASHGWVEVWTPSHGWRGFDPTNGVLASAGYVKIATGRDYRDVAPTRGAFRGPKNDRLTVEVTTRVLDRSTKA